MKILHTSDWHLGRSLYGRKRMEEFSKFLNWLVNLVKNEKIDILLVAGDIFDTTTPGNQVQNLYYDFLRNVITAGCSHVIITGGNHDSPTFLEAPAAILRGMRVHVVGCSKDNLSREVKVITDENNTPRLIVCAVPYLRERDIRLSNPGESITQKAQQLVSGIRDHYQAVVAQALETKKELGGNIPIIAMGHLFAAGGNSVQGDGVRDLYVGSLAHVPATIFSEEIDYVALGHLHTPQLLGGSPSRRYSGSPLPMSFGEVKSKKEVVIFTAGTHITDIAPVTIPIFQALQSITGDMAHLEKQLADLKAGGQSVWLEIIYNGDEVVSSLQDDLREMIKDSDLEILRIINEKVLRNVLQPDHQYESLRDLSVDEVFYRCLEHNNIPEEQRPELSGRFQEILTNLVENDSNAT